MRSNSVDEVGLDKWVDKTVPTNKWDYEFQPFQDSFVHVNLNHTKSVMGAFQLMSCWKNTDLILS